jgi:hypothetical protein
VLLAGQFTAQGARPIVTQLCLGVCVIALRSSDWPPEQVLPVLAQTCSDSLPSDIARSLLLQLVAVLPEEVSSAAVSASLFSRYMNSVDSGAAINMRASTSPICKCCAALQVEVPTVSVPPQRRAHVIAHLREVGGSAAVQLLTAIVRSAHDHHQQQRQQLHAAVIRAVLAWLQLSALTWVALCGSSSSSNSGSNSGTNSDSGSVLLQLVLHSLSSADETVSSLACEAVTALAEAFPGAETAAVLLPPLTTTANSLLSTQQQQQQQWCDAEEVTAAAVRTTGALAACCSAFLSAHTAATAAAAINSDASSSQHWRAAVAVLLSALQAPSLEVASAVVDFWSDVGTACIAGACSLQQEFVQALQLLLSRTELPAASVQVRFHVNTCAINDSIAV